MLETIAIKLIAGMLGVLFFLRIIGKAQMAQITPLDTVSAFVIGALVGGVAYSPDVNVLYLLFFDRRMDAFQFKLIRLLAAIPNLSKTVRRQFRFIVRTER